MKPNLPQLSRLVGNPDAYAVQNKDGSYTPVREPLTDAVLVKHLAHEITVGTYIGHRVYWNAKDGANPDPHDTVVQQTVARTLVFDLDSGDAAYEEAIQVRLGCTALGLPASSVGVEFSGKKGYHVWVTLEDYRPSAELRRVGRAVLALAGVQCEVYPKQDEVRDLGNLVKLPGGLHRVSGKGNEFITPPPLPMKLDKWEAVLAELPAEVRGRREFADVRFPCMDAIQNEGVAEGGRNIQLFHLAVMLRRAGLTAENVEVIVRKTNELGDPLDDFELEQVLDSSSRSGPLCSSLPEDRQCGELCLLTRTKGLYSRPAALRHAAIGEHVVVEVTGRKGNVVEFAHDDVGKMKGVLR